MSGHSHWAGIKHKKAATDAKRGKLWSKLARNVLVAAKDGGGDPGTNITLRYAIDKAKEANMPKDTIEKAIKKGTGDLDGVSFEAVLYEGYGHDGVAIMCQVLTDNRNRTSGELRMIFDKKGGSLGSSGCVAWIFEAKGLFVISADGLDEDAVMEIALEAGAEDFSREGDVFEVICDVNDFAVLRQTFADKEIKTEVSELTQIPTNTVTLDEKAARKIFGLMEMLEDQDDVQNVYGNFDVSDEILTKLAAE